MAEETIFRWPLDDFEERFVAFGLKQTWDSPDFEVLGVPKAKFYIRFYPKGEDVQYKEDCGLYLYVRNFADHSEIRMKYEFWPENGGLVEKRFKKKSIERKLLPTVNNWGWPQICTQAELVELGQEGSLVVACKIKPSDPVNALEWAERTGPLAICRQLAADFDAAEFTDVEVRVQEKTFKVVKGIICAGSPVFRKMFTLDTKEKQSGVVEIKDMDADVIELLLRYLYSGKVARLKGVAHRLLPVADCYEVLHLANMCLESLIANVSVETILRDLKLAFAHDREGQFKQKLVEFAHANFQQVKQQPGWTEEFIQENAKIVLEVTSLCTC